MSVDMSVTSWIYLVIVVLNNLLALGSLVLTHLRPSVHLNRRLTLACGVSLSCVTVAGVAIFLLALSAAFSAVAGADPSQKATLLAASISEATNGLAYAVIGVIFPAATVICLAVRSGKLSRRSPR